MKSLISDPDHIPQKRKKIPLTFPNGKNIPKSMQYMVDKGLKEADTKLHNLLMHQLNEIEHEPPMFEEREFELHWWNNTVFILDNELNIIWVTKDSDPSDLDPEYWKQFE